MGRPFVQERDVCNVWDGCFVRRLSRVWLRFWADHALARETGVVIGSVKGRMEAWKVTQKEAREVSLSLSLAR